MINTALLEKQYYIYRSNAMNHCDMTIPKNANFRATRLAICKAKLCCNYLTKMLARVAAVGNITNDIVSFKEKMKMELDKRFAELNKHKQELAELNRQARIQCRQYSLPG